MGIYQSVRRAKFASKKMTVPKWKIWESDWIDEQTTKVDKRRITASMKKIKKYKATRITNKLKVKERTRSTSRVTEHIEGNTYLQAT